jgi:alkylhydroperoxidase family enzyme
LTRLDDDRYRASAREQLAAHFSEEEQVKLTLLVNVINGWNRLAVGFGLWNETAAAKAAA